MSNNVKRYYSHLDICRYSITTEDKFGDYVLYSDYAKLEARIKELEEANRGQNSPVNNRSLQTFQ